MVQVKIRQLLDSEESLYQQFLELRNTTLRVPIGLDLFKEDLSQEKDQVSLVALSSEEDRVLGCVMLAPCPQDEKTLKLRQMGVASAFQGKGLGTELVSAAENFAKREGKTRILLHARKYAAQFYRKLNYEFVTPEEFIEVGIPHFAMHKSL